MSKKIALPRYLLMLVGYLCFLFGSGGLTFRMAFSSETGDILLIETLISIILMALGFLFVYIAYTLNKYDSKTKTNSN